MLILSACTSGLVVNPVPAPTPAAGIPADKPEPSPAQPAPADNPPPDNNGAGSVLTPVSVPGETNVLVMGTDDRPDQPGRSDTMLLVSMRPNSEPLVLSIPRDTRVYIPGHGYDKVNAAYAYGGPKLAVQTVAGFLGIKVDGYAVVNLQGFTQMVDALGGVTINVDQQMVYSDPYQDLDINLEPGVQRLDGAQAEQYVRFRHDGLGDVGRVARQQKFLKAVLQEALKPANLSRLPQLIGIGYKSVKTDLGLTTLVRLGTAGLNAARDGVAMKTLPGEGKYLDGISYYIASDISAVRSQLIPSLAENQ
jgi:LCP family protein required for cell wall assembly